MPGIPEDLSPEEEVEAFERLKPRLAALWKDVFVNEDAPYTCVIVPSVTFEPRELARHRDALFREETLLFLLTRLRNPRARVVYVTSQPIHKINFSAQTERGALVYMLGALSEFGHVGLLAVGNSRDEAEEVFRRTIEILDGHAGAAPAMRKPS